MRKAFELPIPDSGRPGPPCLSTSKTEDINPLVMSVTAKHQRSKSAPDRKAAFANWDIQDMEAYNQKSASKATKPKLQGVKKKERLISLKQDVEHLQVMLKGQRAKKGVLEQALAQASSVLIPVDGSNYLSEVPN